MEPKKTVGSGGMKRWILYACIGALLLGTILVYLKAASNKKFNLVLITLDALRADHLGIYGYQKNTSPFLDSFFKDAFIFTNVISVAPSTVPSLSGLFTSRYPFIDGAVAEDYTLGTKYITLASFLKNKGYTTMAVVGEIYAKGKFGFVQGFQHYDDYFREERTAEQVVGRVKQAFRFRTVRKPFFLWIHIREPHSPYYPPERYQKMFMMPAAPGDEAMEPYIAYGKERMFTGKQLKKMASGYDGNIRYADDQLRELFRHFQSLGLIKDTIFIVTADHGESLGEHKIFDHNYLYYGILHVPLLLKAPGRKGRVVSDPVSTMDIYPTALDLLNFREENEQLPLRGRSLFMKKGKQSVQFSEFVGFYSLIKDGWRLYVDAAFQKIELFNIMEDPDESKDLMKVRGEKAKLFYDELDEILRSSTRATGPTDPKKILNEEEIKTLKSLGYLN